MAAHTMEKQDTWTVDNCRSVLAFTLLKQIVREFEDSCKEVLDSDEDGEVEFLIETLKDLIPNSKEFLESKFKKDDYVKTYTLSEMYAIAEQCLNDPSKALDYSIHNSLNYFLEDCGEMPDLDPQQIQAKVLKFFFPELRIPDSKLDSFFHKLSTSLREADEKSLQALYLQKISRFTSDIVELRYLC